MTDEMSFTNFTHLFSLFLYEFIFRDNKVMVDNPDFTPSQVGGLFTFLARQLAKPDNTLFVNRKLFDQVTNQILQITQVFY